ncbi:quinolinate synthase NadA [bacterium]|nr:quinolinate synthase NadA [bacterium]MCP5462398.1 quinolinate synthase NadA [bacterium]
MITQVHDKVSDAEYIDRILHIKKQQDTQLVILAHYYQRKEIQKLADIRGDSYELSRKASQVMDARHIVFCGVHFMAQSAATLCRDNQIVHLPALNAGCPMSDMAHIDEVSRGWDEITKIMPDTKFIPITYMNSTAEIKAFCGERDGIVCTSSNGDKILNWALRQGEKIFFFPDEHLGRNMANHLGIPRDQMTVWDPKAEPSYESLDALKRAKIILWKGFCHVHTFFKSKHIEAIREMLPGVVVIVHPECTEEVLALSDLSGSTSFIENYCREAPDGAKIAIATEVNMIDKLADQYPTKTIVEVRRSLCPNMYKNNLRNLTETLEGLGSHNIVTIPDQIRKYARTALLRMIEVTENN